MNVAIWIIHYPGIHHLVLSLLICLELKKISTCSRDYCNGKQNSIVDAYPLSPLPSPLQPLRVLSLSSPFLLYLFFYIPSLRSFFVVLFVVILKHDSQITRFFMLNILRRKSYFRRKKNLLLERRKNLM